MTGAEAWHVPRLPSDERCGVRSVRPKDNHGATPSNIMRPVRASGKERPGFHGQRGFLGRARQPGTACAANLRFKAASLATTRSASSSQHSNSRRQRACTAAAAGAVPDEIVAKACDRFGVIDILVNNAGSARGATHGLNRIQSSKWLTMPSASFGSNQVDFGGIIAPASATAMRSLICVG